MARVKQADRLVSVQEKIRQLQAQEAAMLARQKEQARKDDTRRKVIAGALAIEHFEKNPDSEFARVMLRLLNDYVTRPSDRALFPSLPETVPNGAVSSPVLPEPEAADTQTGFTGPTDDAPDNGAAA